MPGTAYIDEIEVRDERGGDPPAAPPSNHGGHGDGEGARPPVPQTIYVTAVMLGIGAIVMFFMALVSAYIVRRGMGGDWKSIELPRVLWLTTAILVLSSVTIEQARGRLKENDLGGFRQWWYATVGLGLAFLVGQYSAWLQLRAAGVYLPTNPSSSFFYVLTAAHGLHLMGGILALTYVAFRSWQHTHATRATASEAATMYWHAMDGIWIFLFLLLHLGR
ncbi:MAG: heme-copper oxidase subunit III [Acidobacteria bacterium]|nr:heme-copper oxidase subunit III [Acidobacteriota bacterium]